MAEAEETPEEVPTTEEEPATEEPTTEPETEPEPVPEVPPPPQEKPNASFGKISKVLVDMNAPADIQNSKYLTSLPVVPESEVPYTPILYTFRVKPKTNTKKLKNISSKPPPFYLLFDHTIAVIWTLYNKQCNSDSLGISQLQWGLYFLQSIFNAEGVHPKDVQACIDTIQSYLIDEYAEMSQEGVIYNDSDVITPKEEDTSSECFSLNYASMSQKSPSSGGVIDANQPEQTDAELLKELENVRNAVGIDSVDLTKVVSRDQVMNILSDWKREQIEKIEEELKMLYVVEDMMKNSDSQNFEGYTDETQFKSIFKKS